MHSTVGHKHDAHNQINSSLNLIGIDFLGRLVREKPKGFRANGRRYLNTAADQRPCNLFLFGTKSYNMAATQAPIFQNLRAWFSTSVNVDVKKSWNREGGREVKLVKDANFIFSTDASCPDTLRIFESDEFINGFLSVFHTSFIAACLEMNSAHAVAAAKYIILPPDMQEDVQHLAFVKSSHDNVIQKASASDGQDIAGTSKNSDSRHKEGNTKSQKHSEMRHDSILIGVMEVAASDVNFGISDIASIPFVSSLPRVEGEICDFTPGVNGFSVSLKA